MATWMSTSQERRRSPRIAEHIPLAVSEAGTELQTETHNISASGAYCTLERFIAPMTKLLLRLELPNGPHRAKISCTGVVVRVEPVIANADRGRYHIAVLFTELAARDRSIIERFIHKRLATAKSTD